MAERFCVSRPTKECSGCLFAQNGVADELAQATGMHATQARGIESGIQSGDPSAYDIKEQLQRQAREIVARHYQVTPDQAEFITAEHCSQYLAPSHMVE